MRAKTINKTNIVTILVFILLVFTMSLNLLHSPLWGDEWMEYFISQKPIAEQYSEVISTFQPPLYNIIMHAWLKISDSLIWFRFFNVILGTVAGIFIYKSIDNKRIAQATIAILSLTFRWIYYVQDCSEYILSLTAISIAIYCYKRATEEQTTKREILLITASVAAIYSHYGTVFVIAPLLILYFIRSKDKKTTTISYTAAFLLTAIPLLKFYTLQQMLNNEILPTQEETITDFIAVPGRLIAYFFRAEKIEIFGITLGLLLISQAIKAIVKNEKAKDLSIVYISAYILHFTLTKLHIYAMLHPGLSAGFFDRYSLFYIPLLAILVPQLIEEEKKHIKIAAAILITPLILISTINILPNWNKTLDKEFAKIYEENRTENDTIYLIGYSEPGFNYYVGEDYITEEEIEPNNLPNSFWLWRTNWNGDNFKDILTEAETQGYTITVYYDEGDKGQLAYCCK